MTKEEFQKLTQDIVVLDGATGSNLMAGKFFRISRKLMWKQEARSYMLLLSAATVTVSDSTACRTSLLK